MTRRQQLLKQAREHPAQLVDQFLDLEQQLCQWMQKAQSLEDRLSLNSANSSKPPSSDGLAKKPVPKSLRPKSGRRPGGQPGHTGATLKRVVHPHQKKVHSLTTCPCGRCGGVSLRGRPVVGYERRQVFDLPPLILKVTEHQAEIKRCPVSGLIVKASFPEGVSSPTQYGPNFRGLMVYFHNQQILPFDRLRQVCQDLFGQPLSLGTLTQANQRAYDSLQPVENALVAKLRRARLLHLDESGLRVAAALHWLHVACTSKLTFYGVHEHRGREAMDALGILPHCHNWLVHDHWKPYYVYDAMHALCNQHLLRELKFLWEEHRQAWALEMSRFLLKEKSAPQTAKGLNENQFQRARARYRAIVRNGRRKNPRWKWNKNDPLSSKTGNLLDRLQDFDLMILAFLADPKVPFTNNQAEQDIRMIKVKQKISGGFRTLKGAQIFARIRSYLSTCRKHDLNLWEACRRAVIGQPFMPWAPAGAG